MKRKIIIFFIIILATGYSASFAGGFKVILDSSPQKATISTEDSATFEEQLSEKVDGHTAIKLPAETVVSSIEMSQGSQRITDITITPFGTEFVEKELKNQGNSLVLVESSHQKTLYYLVSFNEKTRDENNSPIILKYSVKGISWKPTINAKIIKNNKVSLCFDAIITNNVFNIDSINVILVSVLQQESTVKKDAKRNENSDESREEYYPWQKTNYSSSLIAEYPIGSIALPKTPESTRLINIFCKTVDIADTIYMWKAKEKITKKFSYINNPFNSPLCKGNITIAKNNTVLTTKESRWVEPNESILLLEENEVGITCNASIEVTENFEKRNLWKNCNGSNTQHCDSKNALFYNHQYEFTCQNDTDKNIKLEVVFDKKYGQDHKNIYNFTIKPTKSPGWWHIWEVDLKPKKQESIQFNIDSDVKTYNEYKKYNKAVEGC